MKAKANIKAGIVILYAIMGALFSFFVKTENDLFKKGNIEWNKAYVAIVFLFMLLGAALACLLYLGVRAICLNVKDKERNGRAFKQPLNTKSTYFIFLLINVVSFMPFFLAFFPAICAYDVPVQLTQIVEHAYNEHHPLAHTLLMKTCLDIGHTVFKSETVGMGICAFIQLFSLAAAMAYVIYALRKCEVPFVAQIIVQAWFSLTLINGYMAVSITKDTIFTAGVLFLISAAVLRINGHREKKTLVIFFLAGVFVCLFRNNGIYAFVFMLLFEILALIISKKSRKLWLSLTLTTIVSLVLSVVLLKVLSASLGAVQGDKREMLSVPIQQLSRVMVYEEDKLDAEDKALINDFIINEAYRDYNPVISDPAKKHTVTYVVRYQTGRFARTYFKLLKEYPGDYINAFLALIAGYVSPFDETYRLMKVDGLIISRNYIQHTWTAHEFDYMIHEAPVLPRLKAFLDDFAEKDMFTNPLLRIFYIPGIYLWIYLTILLVLIEKKNYEKIVPLMFVFGFYLTLFLGPTMHLRYLYPLIVPLPIFMAGKRAREK